MKDKILKLLKSKLKKPSIGCANECDKQIIRQLIKEIEKIK